ncbi:MAG TPA: hypothetical protein VEL80_02630 [Burkholderiales bacterium]|nr:hypothetical protein [Burkholderiales bacterium]
MHRVIECKASRDYRLRLKFDDGKAATVMWDDGVKLDPDILSGLATEQSGKRIQFTGACPDD